MSRASTLPLVRRSGSHLRTVHAEFDIFFSGEPADAVAEALQKTAFIRKQRLLPE